MARHAGGLSVEMDGMQETLKAFRDLEADLRKQANAELRQAARTCATVLAGQLARAAMSRGPGRPQSRRQYPCQVGPSTRRLVSAAARSRRSYGEASRDRKATLTVSRFRLTLAAIG